MQSNIINIIPTADHSSCAVQSVAFTADSNNNYWIVVEISCSHTKLDVLQVISRKCPLRAVRRRFRPD